MTPNIKLFVPVNAKVTLNAVHEVKEGSNVSMTCAVTGYPSPTNIHWQFSHRPVANSESHSTSETRSNPAEISSTLVMINATPEMNGTYDCNTPDGTKETHLVVKSNNQSYLVFDLLVNLLYLLYFRFCFITAFR